MCPRVQQVTVGVQRAQILQRTSELWEPGQHCWKSCPWASLGSLQPSTWSWRLHIDLPGPAWACRVSRNWSLHGDRSCRLAWGMRWRYVGWDTWRAVSYRHWLSFSSCWWHWWADTSLSQGMDSRGRVHCAFRLGKVEELGLRDTYWWLCFLVFFSETLVTVHESSTIRMYVFVIG